MDDCIAHLLYGSDLEYTLINQFCSRKYMENILKKLENHMVKYCYYINDCEFCNAYIVCCAEFKKIGFWTHNKYVKCWDVYDPLYNKQNKKFSIKPLPLNMNTFFVFK